MEEDMSPPSKRRKLSPSRSQLSIVEPTPTTAHSIQPAEHQLASAGVRTVPQHIQEIHLQIQERAPPEERGLRRERGTGLDSTIVVTTVNAAGSTIVSTLTVGVQASSTSSTTSSSSTSTTSSATGGLIGNSAKPQDSLNSTTGPTSPASSGTGPTHLTKSDNGTATHNSAKQTKSRKGHHTSLGKGTYLTTLHNGDTKTLTRSDKPYLTTFGNGQVATVCDRHNDCKLSSHKTEKTSKSSPSSTPSSSFPIAVTSTQYVGGAAHAGHESPTAPAGDANTLAQPHNNSNNSSTPPPATIAGGVVGGAAGLAVILLIAMVFLRWYKRRSQQGHHALPPSSTMSPETDYASSSRGPGMAERAGLMPFVGAVPSFFRHQNRSQEEPPPSERGFTRVSGRKLPSAFSEGMSSGGMTSPPPNIPQKNPERNLSTTSWYRDSAGFYGGEGVGADRVESPAEESPFHSDDTSEVVLSPGPRRTPTVHNGGPYFMSPTSSAPATPRLPTVPGSPTVETPLNVARSDTPSTLTDNRSSRFTEEV